MTTTYQQRERQATRRNGRYTKMTRCDICQKTLHESSYNHLSDVGLKAPAIHPHAHIVCHKCEGKLRDAL